MITTIITEDLEVLEEVSKHLIKNKIHKIINLSKKGLEKS